MRALWSQWVGKLTMMRSIGSPKAAIAFRSTEDLSPKRPELPQKLFHYSIRCELPRFKN